MSILRLGLTSIFLLGMSARGDDPPPANSPIASDPLFRATKTDGKTVSGRIRQLGPRDAVVLVTDGGEATIPLNQLIKMEREGAPQASPPEGSLVLFPDGDRLRAEIGNSNETSLQTHPAALGAAAVEIPLDRILTVLFAAPVEPEAAEALLDKVRSEPRKTDVLWLANGDRLAGDPLEIGSEKIKFQLDGAAEPREIERSTAIALGANPAVVRYPRPEGDYLELTFQDGSRLGVTKTRVEQGQVVASTRFGATIQLPLAELSRVHVRGKHVAYLSDREPAGVKYVPYVGPPRPYRRDASVEGRSMRIAGKPYDHGLGMQGRTYVIYRLEKGDRRFQATIGLDDRAGPMGSVVFRVLVDNKDERFASRPITAGDEPGVVDIDVSGARFLILEADFGDRGDIRNFADWVEARLVR
jgi:NPCBM/NEW2 domain